MSISKKYKAVSELIEAGKLYTIEEAVELVKKTSTVKFDATIDVSFKLNINTRSADQQVRGTLVLPHGNGKVKRVLAITDKVEEATAAGADFAGGKELLEKIQKENWFDYDIIVATPNMMGELGKMGRILGPKGLMPNPKTGTVSPDIGKAVSEIKKGKIEYRADKEGNVHLSVARVSFESNKIVENLTTVCETIVKVRPSSVKGNFITNAVIHTTMGPAIKITFVGR